MPSRERTLGIRMVTTGGEEGETKRKQTVSLWRLKGKKWGKERMGKRQTGCPFVVDLSRCRRCRRGFPFLCSLCFVISLNFLRPKIWQFMLANSPRSQHLRLFEPRTPYRILVSQADIIWTIVITYFSLGKKFYYKTNSRLNFE